LKEEKPPVLPNPPPFMPSGRIEDSRVHSGSHIPYATDQYLRAKPDSTITRMERLARQAESEESAGRPEKAYEIYREVLALAPDRETARDVLQDLEMLCMNNPPVRDRGPEVSRELEDLELKMGATGQAAQSAAERADFLEALGKLEEARAEYQRALAAYPGSGWLRIRHARFLVQQGNKEGARAAYEAALSLPDQDDAHEVAREDLEDMRPEKAGE